MKSKDKYNSYIICLTWGHFHQSQCIQQFPLVESLQKITTGNPKDQWWGHFKPVPLHSTIPICTSDTDNHTCIPAVMDLSSCHRFFLMSHLHQVVTDLLSCHRFITMSKIHHCCHRFIILSKICHCCPRFIILSKICHHCHSFIILSKIHHCHRFITLSRIRLLLCSPFPSHGCGRWGFWAPQVQQGSTADIRCLPEWPHSPASHRAVCVSPLTPRPPLTEGASTPALALLRSSGTHTTMHIHQHAQQPSCSSGKSTGLGIWRK